MQTKTKKFISGLAMYCGTVIGVGLFGLPYVASRVGFFVFLVYLLFIGFYSVIISLVYGEMVERTKGLHRLPGYSGIYLGKGSKIITSISGITGLSLSLLAYIVVGGGFLGDLLIPIFGGQKILYILIFFSLGATAIYFSAKSIAKIELLMLCFFFLIVLLLFFKSVPNMQLENFLRFDKKFLFLPYGVLLFSMGGGSIIPEIKELTGKKYQSLLKPILISGSIIVIITYLIFVVSILGVTGLNTSSDSFSGIQKYFDGIVPIFLVFGILTTFTSYLTLGSNLKKLYWYDLKIKHLFSWIFAVFIPLTLFYLGFKNFILIIGVTGAIVGGVDMIFMNLCYLQAKKKGSQKPGFSLRLHPNVIYTIIAFFLAGIVMELLTLQTY